MYRFIADEDFDNDVVRGIKRQRPDIDITRVQDEGLRGAADPQILEWAADEDRILLTHDAATMTAHVADRIRASQSVPKVVVVHQGRSIAAAIEEICRLADDEDPSKFAYPIHFLRVNKTT